MPEKPDPGPEPAEGEDADEGEPDPEEQLRWEDDPDDLLSILVEVKDRPSPPEPG